MNILHLLTIKNDVKFLYSDNTLRQGLEKLRVYGYTAIPVISNEGDYVGTVTEGDFLWHIIADGDSAIKTQEEFYLEDIIRPDFMKAVSVTATAEELIDKAINQNFVPVVDDRNKFIGIVTRKDIIQYLLSRNEKLQN